MQLAQQDTLPQAKEISGTKALEEMLRIHRLATKWFHDCHVLSGDGRIVITNDQRVVALRYSEESGRFEVVHGDSVWVCSGLSTALQKAVDYFYEV